MMTLIDISPSLRVGMGVFPGDAAFAVSQTFAIGPDCPVNVAGIAMSTHCGAHIDAPLHYDPAGASIDMLDLADFIGPARVIDARGTSALCGYEEIASALEGAPPRLLLRLMDRGDELAWPTGFRALASETVERLALRGIAADRRGRTVDRPRDVEKTSRRTWHAGGTIFELSKIWSLPMSCPATTN